MSSRIVALLGIAAALALEACGPALVTTPPTTTPSAPAPTAPPAAPAPVAARALRFTLPSTSPASDYSVRVRTSLERDSAGRSEQDVVESAARVQLMLRRDARGWLRGAGRVDSFTVRATGASVRSATMAGGATTNSAPLPPLSNIQFDVLLDSAFVRTSVRPPLANECDSPEVSAASMARDLLVHVPPSVAVGDRWRDSVVAFVCRGGVPITMRTTMESVVLGTDDGDRTMRIRRTSDTKLEGITRSAWRHVGLSGEGRGTQQLAVDIARGAVISLEGESTLTFRIANGSLKDASRTQRVVQKSTTQIRALR